MSATCVMQSATKSRNVAPLPSPKPKGWAFVNLSEPKQSKDEKLRMFVRSNAMRDYCRKKKKKTKRDTKHQSELGDPPTRYEVYGSSPLTNSSLPTWVHDDNYGGCCTSYCHAECAHDCIYSSSRLLSSPIQRLGDGGTDPFDASPMRGNLRYKGYVLNHCELPTHFSLERMCNPMYMYPLIQI